MATIYLFQLIGMILVLASMIALTASSHAFGTRLSPAEKRRANDEWNRRRNAYRLPINFEAITSALMLLGGVCLLTWSKFNLCAFLTYWLPSLPGTVKLFSSCR